MWCFFLKKEDSGSPVRPELGLGLGLGLGHVARHPEVGHVPVAISINVCFRNVTKLPAWPFFHFPSEPAFRVRQTGHAIFPFISFYQNG